MTDMDSILSIVENPTRRKILQAVVREPHYPLQLSKELGISQQAVVKNLNLMEREGLVVSYRESSDRGPDRIFYKPSSEFTITIDMRNSMFEMRMISTGERMEGEAISWHLYETLGLQKKDTKRIVFHEITKDAILRAIENPRSIDMNLVDAQQARRVLDRLVGFELSPVLWRKIQPKLSAGRVQSVALRLVVDREREIIGFQREQYYKVDGTFHPENTAAGVKVNATLDRRLHDLDEARQFLEDSKDAKFCISSIDKKDGVRTPAAPFTTSTLQQEAARKLRFPVSLTMRIAQSLYERGLITYMRTDSTNLSSLALGTSKKYIIGAFGEEYSKPRQYKTKAKGAQEAHEAIRPTYIENTEIEGTAQEQKLYNLIWKRTIASQMADAKVLKTDIKIASDKRCKTLGNSKC